ncbi:TetR/AcrR family transcriptional regulator [Peterkaempfera griseoplana]|uniref:TetR/AcrR family transcriptional regulator n=1 Tax=Peterkaempfera griseoplana TaxID=66896 RepID=UPI0006E42B72|nr:TetR/AcrR family transcriptional regulator [Peterkaempfera griseoplana]
MAQDERQAAQGARPHTGRRRNEAVRRAILDAALQLMRDGDRRELTIDGIARKAGVGKQTIYRWWPSKGAVLAEALADLAEGFVGLPDTGTLRGDLGAFLAASFRALEEPGAARMLREVMAANLENAGATAVLADFTERRRVALRSLLDRAAGRGEVSPEADPDLLADLAYGFLWYRLLVGHAPLDARAAARLTDHLLAACRPAEG